MAPGQISSLILTTVVWNSLLLVRGLPKIHSWRADLCQDGAGEGKRLEGRGMGRQIILPFSSWGVRQSSHFITPYLHLAPLPLLMLMEPSHRAVEDLSRHFAKAGGTPETLV